ncbi:hypothetical protein GCM10007916_28890 [Psychromonas marina]|uniref:Prepilin-type N-terminal cleavage/methylation domain-containing protein n=1 Tax=Psychromonas marina TaxID=88364 RepID=A0ABQ6E313_9GAMM|nr:hypothetical protein [Psychromonas marina]GLS91819.1 hypothetical protein GCM10007916_28890 [Psychromonas marina]
MLRSRFNTGFALFETVIAIAILGVISASATVLALRDSQYKASTLIAQDLSQIISSTATRIMIHDRFPTKAGIPFITDSNGQYSYAVKRVGGDSSHLEWLKYDDCAGGLASPAISHELRPAIGVAEAVSSEQHSMILPCYVVGDVNAHLKYKNEAFFVVDNTAVGLGYSLQFNFDVGESSIFGASNGGAYFARFYQELVKQLISNEVISSENGIIINEVTDTGSLVTLNDQINDPIQIGDFLRHSVEGTSYLQITISSAFNIRALLSDGSVNINDDKSLCWDSEVTGRFNCITNTDTGVKVVDQSGVNATIEGSSVISDDYSIGSSGYTVPKIHFIRAGEGVIKKPECPVNFVANVATAISSFGDGGGQHIDERDWGDTTTGGDVKYEASTLVGVVATGWEDNLINPDFWDVHSLIASEFYDDGEINSPNISLIAFTWCERA